MGLDVIRFRGGVVDEELICPICTGVLEAPLQAPVIEQLLMLSNQNQINDVLLQKSNFCLIKTSASIRYVSMRSVQHASGNGSAEETEVDQHVLWIVKNSRYHN